MVNPDGTVRSGWPKTLQRAGATWDSVTIGENRRAYAVAVEPEPNDESSISILAFAPNGTREWILRSSNPRRAARIAARTAGNSEKSSPDAFAKLHIGASDLGAIDPACGRLAGSVGPAAPSPSRDRPRH